MAPKAKTLLERAPHLQAQWDYEKNQGIDINTIMAGTTEKYWWKCLEKQHSCSASVRGKVSGKGCKECQYDAKRKHDTKKVKAVVNNDTRNPVVNMVVGDQTEEYFVSLLQKTGWYKNVEKLGHLNGKGDIKITYNDDTFNYIQVKTLSVQIEEQNSFKVHKVKAYPPDMLIVMANIKRDKFALEFSGNLKVKDGLLITFKKKTKYDYMSYYLGDEDKEKDENAFLRKLKELVPFSSKVNHLSKTCKQEVDMINRLQEYLQRFGLTLERNTTNSNTVDGYINGHRIQLKSKIKNATERTYRVSCNKNAGMVDGARIQKPYMENDYDYIIVEVLGTETEPLKYVGNFIFIPMKELIRQDIIKTVDSKGKVAFYICPPDYNNFHWSKKYWNVVPEELYVPQNYKSCLPPPKLKILKSMSM